MKTFTSKEYMLIDIANLAGMDKLLWEDRIEWAKNNWSTFPASSADKPYQYQVAIDQFIGAMRGEQWTKPIGLDATMSGVSIMAVLEHCIASGTATNLCDPSQRYDIYTEVGDEFGFTREQIKRPLMTTFYSSVAQPKALLGDDYPRFLSAVTEKLPGAWDVLKSLEAMHDPDNPIVQWTLPDGHVAQIKHLMPMDHRIETENLGSFTYRVYENMPTDNYRQLAPNVIQSLDAYIAREVVRRVKGEVLPIHDAFYSLPKNMNAVRQAYIDSLVSLATTDLNPMFEEIAGVKVNWVKQDNNFVDLLKTAEYALS